MIQSKTDESRQVGAVDMTDNPMADPNASRTAEIPAATTAPAAIAPQETVRGTTIPAALISVQAEERQDGDDHNHQTDQIDNPVHENLP
jgi:hypothetical protein